MATGTRRVLGLAVEETSWLALELIEALEAAARDQGLSVVRVVDGGDERAVDHVVAVGHPWMYPDLVARPRQARRTLWYGEWLPPHGVPGGQPGASWTWLPRGRRVDGVGRGVLDALLKAAASGRSPRVERALLGVKERAAVAREGVRHLRELAAGAHAFDDVVVTSHDKAAGAARAGVAARVVPYGYHPRLCGPIADPGGDRDIAVLFIGGLATAGFRRGRILGDLTRDAAFPVVAVHGGVHGAERHALLRRVRVVLDVHRALGNLAALRWLHASAAGAVLVTEPFNDPRPLVPGVHFVQADAARLRSATEAVLADEAGRRAMVARCQALLRETLHMSTSTARLMGESQG